MGRLDHKVAIVTGGAAGIGEACTRRFVAEGARVLVADLDDTRGADLAAELDGVVFQRTDMAEPTQIRAAIDHAVGELGSLDVLVNNAAVLMPAAPLQETTDEEVDQLLRVNIRGVWLGCKLAYPHLKRSKGNVINIASMAGVTGQANHAVYGATKGAVNALTRCAAVDWGPDGIRINAICPCGVMTDGSRRWLAAQDDPSDGMNYMRRVHSLQRWSEPEEIGAVAAFLASDDASFVTGALMPVSGGSECGYKL